MDLSNWEDTDELFPVLFLKEDKKVVLFILDFYKWIIIDDDEKKDVADLLIEMTNLTQLMLKKTPEGEAVELNFEALTIIYRALLLVYIIRHTPPVKKIFKHVLKLQGEINQSQQAVDTICSDTRRVAGDYIFYIDKTYGGVPQVKFLKDSEMQD